MPDNWYKSHEQITNSMLSSCQQTGIHSLRRQAVDMGAAWEIGLWGHRCIQGGENTAGCEGVIRSLEGC